MPDLPPLPDDADLLVSDLAAPTTRQRLPRELRPLLNGLSVVVAFALVIAGGVWLHSQASGIHHATPQATTALPPVRGTPPNLPTQGKGWSDAGLPGALTLAPAPTDAATLYSCAIAHESGGPPDGIILGVSADDGATWRTLPTPLNGQGCAVSVDPTDARDLVVIVYVCGRCASAGQPNGIVRSYDGGQHWQSLTFPARPDGRNPDYYYVQYVWAGSIFFLAPSPDNSLGTLFLAAAPAHGPISWVDDRGLFAATGRAVVINGLFAAGATLIVQLESQATSLCPPCTFLMRSGDGGQSWQPMPAQRAGDAPITIISGVPDGATLFGHTGPGPGYLRLLRSSDGGTHWVALPPFPEATLYDLNFFTTPDGTVYATLQFTNDAMALYAAPPGVADWYLVAPLPINGEVDAISFNTLGYPAAIWGARVSDDGIHVQRHVP